MLTRIVGILCCAAGVALALEGPWTNPLTGMHHTNSSTCTSEPCERGCRICCTHYHPNWLEPAAWQACQDNCDQIGGDTPCN